MGIKKSCIDSALENSVLYQSMRRVARDHTFQSILLPGTLKFERSGNNRPPKVLSLILERGVSERNSTSWAALY